MALTAEQFSQLIGGIAGGRADLRRAERISREAPAAIIPLVDGRPGSPVSVRIRDLSPRGVGMMYHSTMERGTQFILRLARADNQLIPLLCHVCHSRKVVGGSYLIGAEFLCIYTPSPGETPEDVDAIRRKILD